MTPAVSRCHCILHMASTTSLHHALHRACTASGGAAALHGLSRPQMSLRIAHGQHRSAATTHCTEPSNAHRCDDAALHDPQPCTDAGRAGRTARALSPHGTHVTPRCAVPGSAPGVPVPRTQPRTAAPGPEGPAEPRRRPRNAANPSPDPVARQRWGRGVGKGRSGVAVGRPRGDVEPEPPRGAHLRPPSWQEAERGRKARMEPSRDRRSHAHFRRGGARETRAGKGVGGSAQCCVCGGHVGWCSGACVCACPSPRAMQSLPRAM